MSRKLPSKIRYVPWSTIQETINKLAKCVFASFRPDVIVAIAKGGLIPARILSDLLGVDEIGVIEAKFYMGIDYRRDKPFIKSIAIPPIKNKRVLVVDDVSDTGRTLQLVTDTLALHAPQALKSLTLYVKPWSTYTPDYFYAVTDEWIVFPWEVCEALREGVALNDPEFKATSEYCYSGS